MNKMEEEKPQRDEVYFVNYYDNIPIGDRGDFLLVLRIVLGGSEFRWQKRLAAWRATPIARKLKPYEIQKLTHLTTEDSWRKTLRTIQRLIPR